jgi:4'-phosphopantetheinyl transferase
MLIEYTRTNPVPGGIDFEVLLSQLPEKLRLKNQKYRRHQDRLRNLYGLLLAKRQLSRYLNKEFDLARLKFTDYNRPFVPGSTFDFNISHAGNYVACSFIDSGAIGLDIEQKRQVDFKDFQRTMNPQQWEYIYQSANPVETFFQFWCRKESVIKADGRGLSIPLKEIIFDSDLIKYPGHSWYFKSFQLGEDHLGCLACNRSFQTLELVEVEWPHLS